MRRPILGTLIAALVSLGAVSPAVAATAARAATTHQPHRIVSLSPTATEMLFAIGAGKQVVAVDDQSNYPARAPKTGLSGFHPNAEAIVGYHPDLVILSDNTVEGPLHALGVVTLVLPSATRLRDTYDQLRRLGAVTGHRASAQQVIARMQGDLATAAATVRKRSSRPAVYWELDDTFYSADSSTFIGQLLTKAGLRDIADQAGGTSSGYPQLSAEYVVHANPAVIFLADTKCCGQSGATLAGRPGFDQVRAVREHRVVALDDDVASRWGPRVVDLFRQIVGATKRL